MNPLVGEWRSSLLFARNFARERFIRHWQVWYYNEQCEKWLNGTEKGGIGVESRSWNG